MHEFFSKTNDPTIPLKDQEFYELRLEDSEVECPGFLVRQTHFSWCELERQIMFDQTLYERYRTLKAAKARYAQRRQLLVGHGFIQSDRDPMG
jgi:hypothetical protein